MLDYSLIEKVLRVLKERDPYTHKGNNGVALYVGGSELYPGASIFACKAALLTGVDLVFACSPEYVGKAINHQIPDIIAVKLYGDRLQKSHTKEIIEYMLRADAILFGNGSLPDSWKVMKELILLARKNVVLDAGALRELDIATIRKLHNSIITPHQHELQTILKNSKREGYVHSISQDTVRSVQKAIGTNVMIFKGHTDYIVSHTASLSNTTGNPFMTKGGTGDVLAGLCLGFLALTKNAPASAATAAYVNGLAGDAALKKYGPSFTVSQMIDEIPEIIKTLIKGL